MLVSLQTAWIVNITAETLLNGVEVNIVVVTGVCQQFFDPFLTICGDARLLTLLTTL